MARQDALDYGQLHITLDGCEVSPSCLTCPRELCKYDEPNIDIDSDARRAERDFGIHHAKAKGMKTTEIARMYNISVRTVHRALAKDLPKRALRSSGGRRRNAVEVRMKLAALRSACIHFKARRPHPPLLPSKL